MSLAATRASMVSHSALLALKRDGAVTEPSVSVVALL